jgi:hypothetical protein
VRVIVVTGGAPRQDDPDPSWLTALEPALFRYLNEQTPDLVIVGCARGIDSLTREWCAETGTDLLIGQAHWRKLKRPAGNRRNRAMALTGCAFAGHSSEVRVGAFPGPRSTGTWNMIELCEGLGLTVDRLGPWAEKRP